MPSSRNFDPYYDEGRGRWIYPAHLLSHGVDDSQYGEYTMLRHLQAMAERFPSDYGAGTTIWDKGGQSGSGGGFEEELKPLGRFSDDANNFANFEWYSKYRDDGLIDPIEGDEGDPPVPDPDQRYPEDGGPDAFEPITNTNRGRTLSKTFYPTEDYENTIRANAPQRGIGKL